MRMTMLFRCGDGFHTRPDGMAVDPQELRVIQWSGFDLKTGVASVMKVPRIEVGNGHADPASDRMLYRRPLLILLSGR